MRFQWNFLNLILFFVYIVASTTKFDKMCSSDHLHLDFRRKPFSLLMPMLPRTLPRYFDDQKKKGRPIATQVALETWYSSARPKAGASVCIFPAH